MKKQTLNTLLRVCSPDVIEDLLVRTFPEKGEAIVDVASILYNTELTEMKKYNAIKKRCGIEVISTLNAKLEDALEAMESDRNFPLLKRVLQERMIFSPADFSFEDLVIWTYTHYPLAWDNFLTRSYTRFSLRHIATYKAIPSCTLTRYESQCEIDYFENWIPQICKKYGCGFGQSCKILFDDYSEEECRSIVFLSPIPFNVMTCKHGGEKIFEIRPNENTIKLIFYYNNALEELTIYGSVPNRKQRLEFANAWLGCFIGGCTEKEVEKKRYDLTRFNDVPTALNFASDVIKSMELKMLTMGDGKHGDVSVGPTKKERVIDVEIARHYLAYNKDTRIVHVVLSVTLIKPMHGIRKFDLSISENSISLDKANSYDDLYTAVHKVLGECHVYTGRL